MNVHSVFDGSVPGYWEFATIVGRAYASRGKPEGREAAKPPSEAYVVNGCPLHNARLW